MATGLYFVYEGELLHQAAIYDRDDFLAQLLSNRGNGDANSKDPVGRTPVHTAAQHGSLKCLKLLLDSGGNPNLVSSPGDHSSTPVHYAAFNGHLDCIRLLAERGADLDIQNAAGMTPIELAIQQSRPKCVQFLQEEAARRRTELEALLEEELYMSFASGKFRRVKDIIEKLGEHFNVDKHYHAGETLLLRASEKGHLDTVELLIAKGATGLANPFTGITPLYVACAQGHADVARILLEKYPGSAMHGTKVENNNPLHIVSGNGPLEILKLLLQTDDGSEPHECIGLDMNCQTTSGMTPLHNAAIAGNVAIVKMLLRPNHRCRPPCKMNSDVDVNARSKVGRTPLHDSVTLGHVDVVAVLLENHANPNCVARTDELSTVDELQDEIADMVEISGASLVTPLELACYQKRIEMVKVLLRYGAKDLKNNCLQYAVANKDDEMIDVLLGKGAHPTEEYKLPPKLREQRSDLAPVSIVWHNYSLAFLETNWIYNAPKAVLKADVVASMNQVSLAATITNLDISKNRLETLPVEIFQLPSLKHLSASHNEINLLPCTGKGSVSAGSTSAQSGSTSAQSGSTSAPTGSTSSDDVFGEKEATGVMWYCPHLEEIELQNNNLTSLPGCLFLLPSLKTLNASKNDIGNLPFDLWNTPNLRTVLLSNNYIKSLPILPNASEVFSSNLNGSKWKRPSEPADWERRSAGSTSRDRTEDVKDTKPQVQHIRVTSLRSSWGDGNQDNEDSEDDEDGEDQTECPLEKIDLSFNRLEKFPVGLPCLSPKLSKLLLSNNNIERFPPIQEIPERLSHLDLSFNKLTQCSPSRQDRHTDRLCYSPVQKRRAPKRRNRSRTSASTPPSRPWCRHCRHKRLHHMKRLELHNNVLREVHFLYRSRAIQKASSMVIVQKEEESAGGASTSPNGTGNSSPCDLCVFPNLISLTLSDNKLEALTEELGQLSKLGSLDVSNNPLTKYPRLPPELGMLGDLWDLNLKGLYLVDPPPNVLEKRTKAITGYLLSVLDKSKPYPNMKLMFVGEANIGKTTLLGRLREDGYVARGWHERRDSKKPTPKGKKSENVSTVGVDVAEWAFPNPASYFKNNRTSIKFSTWDFGGQNEYYATHQYFLTRRALYLAIWKLTDGEQGVRNLKPWLLNIQARAPDSVVIIVSTFYDRLSSQQRKNGFVENMHELIYQLYVGKDLDGGLTSPRERGLPRVVRVIDVSCTTGHNIQMLRDVIYTTALEIKGPGRHSLIEEQRIPASYLAVKAAVKKVAAQCYAANQTPVLKADQFRKKVEAALELDQVRLRDFEELEQACQFLHDDGVLLHYDDPSLSSLYFLDPQWLCDMLAHVVAIRDVNPFAQNGLMRFSDLSHIFRSDRFPSNLIREYVDLLNKFEVALPWHNDHLLVPSLLPENQIKSLNFMAAGVSTVVARSMNMTAYTENRVLRRQYVMSYVPSGFWARLITRMINNKQIKNAVGECMEFLVEGQVVTVEDYERAKISQPEWSCWKTGLELSCYGVKLLRVCQLQNTPFYGCPEDSPAVPFLVGEQKQQTMSSSVVEVIAPSVVMGMEKFVVQKGARRGTTGNVNGSAAVKNFVGFRVNYVSDSNIRTAARFLALTVDHIDTLLSDWYPGLDTTNIYGENLVTRLIPCQKCIRRVIALHSSSSASPRQSRVPGENRNVSQTLHGDSDDLARPSSSSCGKSTFYDSLGDIHDNDEAARPETSKQATTEHVDSPSSDSESSSGLGTDSSYVGVEHGYESGQSSPECRRANIERENSFHQRNGCERGNTDSEAEDSRGNSQTSGVPPSPRQETDGMQEGVITAFEFEQCVVCSHNSDCVSCPVDGELPLKELAPDVVFADIAPELKIEPCNFTRKKYLGRGNFGTVYAGEIKRGGKIIPVALKMPLDNDPGDDASAEERAAAKAAQRKAEEVPHQMFTEAYRIVRQELSILINLDHPHILQLQGFCLSPLSLILEFAPQKSLDKILAEYKRAGPRLDPYVLQKCVVQCSAALKYVHKLHIIYRDLKSENILVWEFPAPFSPNQADQKVMIKVADYGISRTAAIAGAKGLGGTPGFMAPEIEKYSGRETYTDKVDSFSFGMFMYELITLSQPFTDMNAAQVKQLTVEGKRPPLTSKDKRAPIFALELMSWCWAANPEERPSSSQIYSVSLSPEFPRLVDVLTFDEVLHLSKSITTGSRDYAGHGADGQLSIGKEVWLFHSRLNAGVHRETVDVLCYSNGRCNHLEEYVVGKHVVIRVACSVGSTVWLGSEAGFIYVYCAITYKQLCQGTLLGDKYILSMIHVPKCNCVLVALSNGHIMAYSDNVYSHSRFKESCDLTSPKDLSPLRIYSGTRSVHCMAAVEIPKGTNGNVESGGSNRTASPQVCYEVWCGEQRGRIGVLSADTLKEKTFLPAEDCDMDNPCLENLTVTRLETCQTYAGSISPSDPLASSVWVAVYPGTSVYRYDARTKRVVNSVDCAQNRPIYEGNYQIYGAGKNRTVTKSQVLSLLVVNRELFIGTSSGCFLICNSLSLLVYSVLRCHDATLEGLLPLTTTPVTWNYGAEDSSQKEHSKLVLTCGKGYRSLCSGRAGNGTSADVLSSPGKRKRSFVLVWLADERESGKKE